MTCFTGDIHDDPGEIAYFCNRQELTKADVLVTDLPFSCAGHERRLLPAEGNHEGKTLIRAKWLKNW